jgi:hypothetical protein
MFLTPCAQAALHKCSSLKKIINTLPLGGRVLNLFFGLWDASLIYSSTFCETKKTADYTDSTDRNRTVPKNRAIRVIRGLNSGVHNVVTTVDGFVNNSG